MTLAKISPYFFLKWKCKNWIVNFKKFDNLHHSHLTLENFLIIKNDVFNFHPIFLYCYHQFHTRFLKTYIKSGNVTEKKNKTLKDF